MFYVWLIIAIVSLIIATFTVDAFSIVSFLASLITLAINIVSHDESAVQQVICFAIIMVVGIIVIRPLLKKFNTKTVITGNQKLIGQEAVVIKEINPHAPGQIKVRGQIWSARSDKQIPQNSIVKVISISGNYMNVEESRGE